MIKQVILLQLLISTVAYTATPPKPGVVPSDKIVQQLSIMAESYQQGGLAAKMQRVKAANIEAVQSEMGDLREDVFGSFPVILGSYADSDDNPNVVEQLQRELFDGPWPSITMAEHYEQMSYGQYHLSGQVYGWYELSQPSEYYEGSQSSPYDNGFISPPGGVGSFLTESLDLADIEIDFTQYDNDGDDGVPNSGDDDGRVDATFFVHSGRGGETGGPSIWSHRWVYSSASGTGAPYMTNDIGFNGQPIQIQDYIMQPAVAGGSQGNGGLIEIGVFSHEFGHALGLPDLYDTDYSSNGLGSWCLMASGSWSSPSSPVHMSAWCKEMLGWTIPIVLGQNEQNVEIPNAEEHSFAIKLWTHGQIDPFIGSYSGGQDVGQEYYLIENRQRIGSEQFLPGTGLVIWHVDNALTSNSDENHRMVDIKAADGHINGSNAGDSWPGMTNNRNFDYETEPSSVGWSAVNTEVAVLNISDSNPTMFADLEVHESNPHLNIADMLLVDFNGDNILAPGENVLIWLIIDNTGASANNATATLSVDGDAITLIDSVITFDPVGFLQTSTSNLAFEFTISDTLTPRSVPFVVTFDADEIVDPYEEHFDLLLGTPDVVLIDDDGATSGASDYQFYYTDALYSEEIVHVVWDVAERGLPDLAWLDDFETIIWFSGDQQAPLNATSTALIADYLNGGGNLLLSGQNLATGDASVAPFVSNYFAVEVLADDIQTSNVYGDPSHGFFNTEDRYALDNSHAANNQISSDSFTILDGGSSMFMYPFLGLSSSGASVKNTIYSAVLLGFGIEAITHFDGTPAQAQGALIHRLIQWMKSPLTSVASESFGVPTNSSIIANYPNPFNPSITFDVQLVSDATGILQIVDLRGALVKSIDLVGSGTVEWRPSATVSGGVYFVRLAVDDQVVSSLAKITYLK